MSIVKLPLTTLAGILAVVPLCMAPGVDPCGSCIQSFHDVLGPEGRYHELTLRAGQYQLRSWTLAGTPRLRLIATDPRRPAPEVRCREEDALLECELRVVVDGTIGLAVEPSTGTREAELVVELERTRAVSSEWAPRSIVRGVIELAPRPPVLAPTLRRGI